MRLARGLPRDIAAAVNLPMDWRSLAIARLTAIGGFSVLLSVSLICAEKLADVRFIDGNRFHVFELKA